MRWNNVKFKYKRNLLSKKQIIKVLTVKTQIIERKNFDNRIDFYTFENENAVCIRKEKKSLLINV